MKTCIFPGSFDPPTVGHVDIARRAAALFDRVVVAVMDTGQKKCAFTPGERADMLETCLAPVSGVEVVVDGGLLTDLAKRVRADAVVRGLRGEADCAAEGQTATIYRWLSGIETIFFFSKPEHSPISSTMVREVARHGGEIGALVPEEIRSAIEARFRNRIAPDT